jgi:hypothetical protein
MWTCKKGHKWSHNLRDHLWILQVCHLFTLQLQTFNVTSLLGLLGTFPSSRIAEDQASQLWKSEPSEGGFPESLPSSTTATPLKWFTKPQEHTLLRWIIPSKIISWLESILIMLLCTSILKVHKGIFKIYERSAHHQVLFRRAAIFPKPVFSTSDEILPISQQSYYYFRSKI